jgi:hypothetical protein
VASGDVLVVPIVADIHWWEDMVRGMARGGRRQHVEAEDIRYHWKGDVVGNVPLPVVLEAQYYARTAMAEADLVAEFEDHLGRPRMAEWVEVEVQRMLAQGSGAVAVEVLEEPTSIALDLRPRQCPAPSSSGISGTNKMQVNGPPRRY